MKREYLVIMLQMVHRQRENRHRFLWNVCAFQSKDKQTNKRQTQRKKTRLGYDKLGVFFSRDTSIVETERPKNCSARTR